MLALVGGAIGLAIGSWGSGFLAKQLLGNATNLPRVFDPDARILIFTAITVVLTVLGFGFAPTLRAVAIARNTTPGASLRGGIDRSAMKGMRSLVALQVALAVVLVFAAVLLGRTLLNFTSIDPGFSGRLVVGVFDPVSSGYSPDQARTLDRSLIAAVHGLPGVNSVAVSRCGLIADCTHHRWLAWSGDTGTISAESALRSIGAKLFRVCDCSIGARARSRSLGIPAGAMPEVPK